MARLLALGLDSVEESFLEELIGRGELPFLAQLRARSARVRLQIPGPYRSEASWTEFVAGRGASALRYWSTVGFDPATYRCLTAGAARVRPFYARPDCRVIALDVPHARPSLEVNGVQVIGWGCHDPQFPRCSLPAGLLSRLEAHAGAHPAPPIEYAGAWNQPRYLRALGKAQADGAARRVAVIEELMREVPDWDFLLAVLSEAHHSGHHMWHGVSAASPLHAADGADAARESLLGAHRAMDASLARIAARAGPETTLVVFSIKGMEPADAEVAAPFLVPELLHRLHFGTPALHRPPAGSSAPPPLVPPAWRLPDALARRALGPGRWQRLDRAADAVRARLPHLSRGRAVQAASVAEPVIPADPMTLELTDHDIERWHPACWYRAEWRVLQGFVIPSFSDVHLRINLAGRERDGVVAHAEYASACDALEAELRACRDARTGQPVFGEITRMRPSDPHATDGPSADLVARCAGPVDVISHPRAGRIGPFPFLRTGSHTTHGFAWCSGPGVCAQDLGARPASDLPPTLLGLLGLPRDTDMEGSAITGFYPALRQAV
jgi:predicted AlkP superfamily phosphohydrolase/phosphomutase